jgi:transcriptional regulator with XRE-family HTH domain
MYTNCIDGIFGGGEEAMGQQLKKLRAAAGLSQSQLARAAGVPVATLKNWEQGRRQPLLGAACKLADALGVGLDELAGRAPAPKEGRGK